MIVMFQILVKRQGLSFLGADHQKRLAPMRSGDLRKLSCPRSAASAAQDSKEEWEAFYPVEAVELGRTSRRVVGQDLSLGGWFCERCESRMADLRGQVCWPKWSYQVRAPVGMTQFRRQFY